MIIPATRHDSMMPVRPRAAEVEPLAVPAGERNLALSALSDSDDNHQ